MLNIIVAIGEGNRVIGNHGNLPWNIPEDLKRFREITTGHPVIMGRNTFSSIGRILPNRTNIVLSDRSVSFPEGVLSAISLEDAIGKAKMSPGGGEIFIIGGGMVYRQALPIAERLYLTLVRGNFEGDVFFPEYSELFPEILLQEERECGGYRYEFLLLSRGKNLKSKFSLRKTD